MTMEGLIYFETCFNCANTIYLCYKQGLNLLNIVKMQKKYFTYLVLLLIVGCSKKEEIFEQPMKTFTFTGTVTDDETAQPITGAWIYLLHGKMSCCISPDVGATLDSVKKLPLTSFCIASNSGICREKLSCVLG